MFYGSCRFVFVTLVSNAGTGFFTSACRETFVTHKSNAGAHPFTRSGHHGLVTHTSHAAAPFMRACHCAGDTQMLSASTRLFTVPAIFEMSPNIGLPEHLFNRSGQSSIVAQSGSAAAPFYEAGHRYHATQAIIACFAFSPIACRRTSATLPERAGAHFSRTPPKGRCDPLQLCGSPLSTVPVMGRLSPVNRIPEHLTGETTMQKILAELKERHRTREDFHRAEKRMTLQIKSICRRMVGGDKVEAAVLYKALKTQDHPLAAVAQGYLLPFLDARVMLHAKRMEAERRMAKLVTELDAYDFIESVHGFGAIGFAQILGESGDLSNYSNPAKLWKRFGLAVINGGAQRKVKGAEALEHGYSPRRRSIMFVIGDSLIKKQNPYRELYLARKIVEEGKDAEGTKMAWHRRAQRYMEKRLLRDLWRAWNRQTDDDIRFVA